MRGAPQWLLTLVTIAILGALLYPLDWNAAFEIVRQSNPYYHLLCIGIMLFFPLLSAWRWKIITRQLGAPITLWESVWIVMAAWPLGAVTPAKSGDLVKILFLRNMLPYAKTTGVILAERMMDLAILSLCALLGGLWLSESISVWIGGGFLLGMVLFYTVASTPLFSLLPQRIGKLSGDVLEASVRVYTKPLTLLLTLAITLLNWSCTFLQTWIIFLSLGAEVPLTYTLSALPIAIFVGLIPITLSGMGTRDSAIVFLFQNYTTYEASIAAGLLYSIYGYWLLTLIGIPFMRSAFTYGIRGVGAQDLQDNAYLDEIEASTKPNNS